MTDPAVLLELVPPAPPPQLRAVQTAFDELGTPLREVTFVVVDLETTGGSAATCEITEIGAVKVRGGEVLGEFQTLVRPQASIPPFIAVLTGITDVLVADAPAVSAVLPAFLEFSRDAVLVAHNAPFDIGFLREACSRLDLRWPAPPVVDTALLARRVVSRDETPDCKLASLATLFRAGTLPVHRALADARATVDVLHGLLERVGPLGVQSLEELLAYSSRVSEAQRRKRHLAEGLPEGPGVYVFRDATGRPLYVGTSGSVRSRVRQYFTGSELRSRMAEMVAAAEAVTAVPCASAVEARVRELRLIAEHAPPYNRRSRHPERATWVKLTDELFPRLARVRAPRDDGAAYLGPFGSARRAEQAVAALHEVVPLRQCTGRIAQRGGGSACALAEIGRCDAPCEARVTPDDYARHVDRARAAMLGDVREVLDRLEARVRTLAERERYEAAAGLRDRIAALLSAAARGQRLSALAGVPQLVAARPSRDGGWELLLVRYGRLAGSCSVQRGLPPRPAVDALIASGERVAPGPGPLRGALAEEVAVLASWLEADGVRLVELEGTWASPAFGAAGAARWLRDRGRVEDGMLLGERRSLRPASMPGRLVPARRGHAAPGRPPSTIAATGPGRREPAGGATRSETSLW